MPNAVIVGTQWGDEGKGKIIDFLAPEHDIIARYQGGANAGHTVIHGNKKFVFHLIPSGILHDKIIGVLGNGVVIDPLSFFSEIERKAHSRLSKKTKPHQSTPRSKAEKSPPPSPPLSDNASWIALFEGRVKHRDDTVL